MYRLPRPTHTLRRDDPRGAEFSEVAFLMTLLSIALIATLHWVAQLGAAHAVSHAAVHSPTAALAPHPALATHGSSVNLPLILAIVAGIAGVPFLGWGALRLAAAVGARQLARRRQAEAQASMRELFTQLVQRHATVQDAWAVYREDIGALLAAPALGDVSVPQTAAFVDAAGRALDLRPEKCPETEERLSQYETAVRALERAWQLARDHADRVGTGLLSPEERKKVSQALDLLAIARDGGASANERRMAYQRVTALLDGILTVPAEAIGALESAVRRALEAA